MRGRLPFSYKLMRKSDPRLFGIPAIVEAELFAGAQKSNKPQDMRLVVQEFMLPFQTIPFDSKAAYAYGVIRAALEHEGKIIGSNDLLIAATALAHQAVLVTNNVNEFKRVPGLSLESWHEENVQSYSS